LEDFDFKPLTEGLGFNSAPVSSGEGSGSTFRSTKSSYQPRSTEKSVERPIERPIERSTERSLERTMSSAAENDLLGRGTDREENRSIGESISDLIASLPPSLDFIEEKNEPGVEKSPNASTRPQIYQPFARDDFKAGPSVAPALKVAKTGPTVGSALGGAAMGAQVGNMTLPTPGSAVVPSGMPPMNAPAANSPYRERLNESFAKAFPHADRRSDIGTETRSEVRVSEQVAVREKKEKKIIVNIPGFEAVPTHFGAGFIDAMVVAGISMIFLVSIILITHINLRGLLGNAQTDGPTQLHLVLLFLSVLQLYYLTARSFFGASLGEWAFDLQLGTAADQEQTIYPLQVALRTLITSLTGLVVLPALSLILGRDLLSGITGPQLYRRV
jgi:RDD family